MGTTCTKCGHARCECSGAAPRARSIKARTQRNPKRDESASLASLIELWPQILRFETLARQYENAGAQTPEDAEEIRREYKKFKRQLQERCKNLFV